MLDFSPEINQAWENQDLKALQKAIKQAHEAGEITIPTMVDAVRYSKEGISFQEDGLEVALPEAEEVLILPVATSLCGTDVALIDKAHAGKLPAEAVGKVVGHEAAGFVLAVGEGVTDWQPGQLVCLDSHFACNQPEHEHFDDCVASGASCDGIVGGIRGAQESDGSRTEPRDGYWSRLITVPASALPLELPVEIAQHLAAPSTLESLGNIYMMVEQLEQVGLLESPEKTLVVVSGLGATGYPMAAVATHYGFEVVGINPSAGKREFALEQEAVTAAYETMAEVATHTAGKENVMVIVTAGAEAAHREALDWLESLAEAGKPDAATIKRRAAIIFGLFSDPEKPLPYTPTDLNMPQRDFVFSRQSFKTDHRTEVYGVCGRDLKAWEMLMHDLQPKDGQPPKLLLQLNEAIHVLAGESALQEIAEILDQGSKAVADLLKENKTLKLAANFLR